MATQFKPNSDQLLQAIQLFEQTLGPCKSEVELQATLSALRAVMSVEGDDVRPQVAFDVQQSQPLEPPLEPTSELQAIVQRAKGRLTKAEKTLVAFVRTYLQRISSKLSAQEFTAMVQAAVVLLDKEQPGHVLSLPERKYLLCHALETFGDHLSQPIPAIGERIDQPVKRLITRLVRYQRLSRVDGVKAAVDTIAQQFVGKPAQALSPELILAQLDHSEMVQGAHEALAELAEVVCFQLQLSPATATHIDPKIKAQVNQTIVAFQAKYRPWVVDVAKPVWDGELSVGSSLFRANGLVATGKRLTWAGDVVAKDGSVE